MNTFITLMKLTDQGAKDLKGAPKRIEDGIKAAEKMGGKIIGFYAIQGEYDYIAIAEVPSDEVGSALNLALTSQGYVRTTAIRAFTINEFANIIKKLP